MLQTTDYHGAPNWVQLLQYIQTEVVIDQVIPRLARPIWYMGMR